MIFLSDHVSSCSLFFLSSLHKAVVVTDTAKQALFFFFIQRLCEWFLKPFRLNTPTFLTIR